MIIKVAAINNQAKENIARLGSYLLYGKNHEFEKNDRVLFSYTQNMQAEDVEDSYFEMQMLAKQNKRSKTGKFLHLIVSLKAGEHLSQEQWKESANKIASTLDLKDHQFFIVAHKDTDNEHIHIVFNRINPKTKNSNCLPFIKRKLANLATELEKSYGLTLLDHSIKNSKEERNAKEIEALTGQESFLSYVSKFKEELLNASSWDELQKLCHDKGIAIKKKGTGLVFTSIFNGKDFAIKASSVDRKLSFKSLTAKLGNFETEKTSEIISDEVLESFNQAPVGFDYDEEKTKKAYQYYLKNQEENKDILNQEINKINSYINKKNSKLDLLLKRLTILEKKESLSTTEFFKVEQLKSKIDSYKKKVNQQAKQQISELKKVYGAESFLDFLKSHKEKEELRELLLTRKDAAKQKEENWIEFKNINNEVKKNIDLFYLKKRTNKGMDIYSSRITGQQIKDDGTKILLNNKTLVWTTFAALNLAKVRNAPYESLKINGTEEFQFQCALVGAHLNLNMNFSNRKISNLYQALIGEEKHGERDLNRNWSWSWEGIPTRPARIRTEATHLTASIKLYSFERTLFIKKQKSTTGKMYLSDLSTSNMDELGVKSKLLLSQNKHDFLGQSRQNEISRELRWQNRKKGERTIREYLAERNKKAIKGLCNKHKIFEKETGEFKFLGLRNLKEGKFALLEQNGVVLVRAISGYTLGRLEKTKVGSLIYVNNKNKVTFEKSLIKR